MYGYIYETTCLINGMKYIGMHKWDKDSIDPNYLGSGLRLIRAIEKYGKNNFRCEILEWCETRDILCEKEKYYISLVSAPINENYYNINDGGFGGHGEHYIQPVTAHQLECLDYGRHLPASQKLKDTLSNYRKNVIVSDKTKEKLHTQQSNKCCVNNGLENKIIDKCTLQTYLDSGWIRGMIKHNREESINKFKKTHYSKDEFVINAWKQKLSNSLSGRKWMTKDNFSKQVKPEDIDKYLSDGWIYGRSKVTKKFND